MGELFNGYKKMIEDHLLDFVPDIDHKSITLYESMKYSLTAGGKRLRPVLLLGASGTGLGAAEGTDPLSLIVKGFAADTKPGGIDAEGKVRLAELASLDDRVGFIFNEIIDLTRNQDYRYRDIRIVCCNEDIMTRMRSTAELYGLDVFIDRKIALGGTVVPYMMQIVLELPRAGYTLELIMKAMRSGMLSPARRHANSL